MPQFRQAFCVLLSLLVIPATAWSTASARQAASPELVELDAYWAEASRTVAAGDFGAYSALYHPDAVLVSADSTAPIAEALRDWEPGFVETRAGKSQPQVHFRFTRRVHDATTAHETGIFRFTAQTPGAEARVQFVQFEALLVKRSGGWLMLMEYQKGPATPEQWDAAGEGR